MHLGALGEGHHPRVEEHAGRVAHRELPVLQVEHARVGEDRHRAHHDGGRDLPPAEPPDDHVDDEHREQRLADRAQHDPEAQQQADDRAAPGGRPGRIPQQQRGGQGEHEQERHVGEDQVLELDLEPVVEHRHGGQRGQPGRGAETVPGQRVDHHADRQAHKMLQNRYEGIAVKGLQDLEQDRIPGHAGRVEVEVNRVRQVLERVVEPGLPPVPELGVRAQQHGRDEHDDEQPVPGPDARGQRSHASWTRCTRPDGLSSPRRWRTRRGPRHYPQPVPSCAGLTSLTLNVRPAACVSSPAYGNTMRDRNWPEAAGSARSQGLLRRRKTWS